MSRSFFGSCTNVHPPDIYGKHQLSLFLHQEAPGLSAADERDDSLTRADSSRSVTRAKNRRIPFHCSALIHFRAFFERNLHWSARAETNFFCVCVQPVAAAERVTVNSAAFVCTRRRFSRKQQFCHL